MDDLYLIYIDNKNKLIIEELKQVILIPDNLYLFKKVKINNKHKNLYIRYISKNQINILQDEEYVISDSIEIGKKILIEYYIKKLKTSAETLSKYEIKLKSAIYHCKKNLEELSI